MLWDKQGPGCHRSRCYWFISQHALLPSNLPIDHRINEPIACSWVACNYLEFSRLPAHEGPARQCQCNYLETHAQLGCSLLSATQATLLPEHPPYPCKRMLWDRQGCHTVTGADLIDTACCCKTVTLWSNCDIPSQAIVSLSRSAATVGMALSDWLQQCHLTWFPAEFKKLSSPLLAWNIFWSSPQIQAMKQWFNYNPLYLWHFPTYCGIS